MGISLVVTIAMQYHLAPQVNYCLHLDAGGGTGHDDGGPSLEAGGRQCHTLAVVAGRRRHHTFFQDFSGQARHVVVGSAQLVGKHPLLVFALEPDLIMEAARQYGRQFQRGLMGHVVDPRGQYLLYVFLH